MSAPRFALWLTKGEAEALHKLLDAYIVTDLTDPKRRTYIKVMHSIGDLLRGRDVV